MLGYNPPSFERPVPNELNSDPPLTVLASPCLRFAAAWLCSSPARATSVTDFSGSGAALPTFTLRAAASRAACCCADAAFFCWWFAEAADTTLPTTLAMASPIPMVVIYWFKLL